MTVQMQPHDLESRAGRSPAGSRRSWSARWTVGAACLTVLVDLLAVWAVVHLFGPVGLLTAAVLAVGGLYLVATRPSSAGLSAR